MNSRKLSRVICRSCCVAVLASSFAAACATGNKADKRVPDNSQARLVQYLDESLGHVSSVVRVDYYVPHSCGINGLMQFPHMELRKPVMSSGEVASVHSIFRAYGDVAVKKMGTEVIVVRVGTPTNDLLATPIKSIHFSGLPQYNAVLAVAKIMGNKAVRHAAAKAAIFPLSVPISGFVVLPGPGAPHLPRKIDSVTLGGALNRVAVTFSGVVVFSVCKNPNGSREVQIYFNALHRQTP